MIGANYTEIIHIISVACQDQVQYIAPVVCGIFHKLGQVVVKNEVTENVRRRAKTSQGRPIDIRKVEVARDDYFFMSSN